MITISCGVYKITNLINNKSYIGVSIHIEQRWREHQNGKGSAELHKDIIKYGLKNFSFEILEECDEKVMYLKEPKWIKYYNSYKNGYNQNPGGINSNLQAIKVTKKTVYCYDLKGNFLKTYESLNEAERLTGVPNSNISKAARGERKKAGNFQWSYEKFDKIKPYIRTCIFKEKKVCNNKKVNQYNLENKLLNTFNSIAEASRKTGVNKNSIGMVCNKQRKTAGGFIWKFADEVKI